MAANSDMVAMVLLVLPRGLDLVRVSCVAIRRREGDDGHRRDGGRVREELLRVQARFFGSSFGCDCWDSSAFWLHLCLRNQDIELPNKIKRELRRFHKGLKW